MEPKSSIGNELTDIQKLNTWATDWLRETYGLEDGDTMKAEEVEEMLQQALYDFKGILCQPK